MQKHIDCISYFPASVEPIGKKQRDEVKITI